MSVISMKALLESGVHFGHRTHKWHPGMKPYIFTERNGIHIIDLQKTVKAVEIAYNLVRDSVSTGGVVLFVGTKRQAQETIQMEAARAGMPYVTDRWLGGMITNWRTMRARINELERLERMRDSGDFGRITKKEGLIITRQIERLEVLLGGIRTMTRVPDLMFVVDVMREATAIHEANLLDIPVIGMVDTNCDPRDVDYVIPSNDDAIRAIKLMVAKIADACIEGKAARKEEVAEDETRQAMTPRSMTEEPELADEDLLGESTLAKISKPVELEEVPAEVAAQDVPAEVEAQEQPQEEEVPEVEEQPQAEEQPQEEELPQEEPQEEVLPVTEDELQYAPDATAAEETETKEETE